MSNDAPQDRYPNPTQLLTLLEDSLDGIWDWSVQTGDDYLSPRWKERLGYAPEELPDKVESWERLLLPEDVPKAYAAVQAHFERGEQYSVQLRYRRKDGSIAWMLARGAAVADDEGTWVRMAGTHTDITPLKDTEAELRASEQRLRELSQTLEARVAARTAQLEAKNKELEQFTYAASHDLRSPLRAALSVVTWIREDVEEGRTHDLLEHVRLLESRLLRMRQLHDDLLAYSRAAKLGHQVQRITFGDLVRASWDLVDAPTGFALRVSNDGLALQTNPTPLRQVLQNLLSNAVRHHDHDQGHVEVSIASEGPFWRIHVTDDGPGIAATYHQQVFEIFQTLRSRDRGGGSGVGLALVRRIVRGLSGEVNVVSEGRGTTFSFTWPQVWPAEPNAPETGDDAG